MNGRETAVDSIRRQDWKCTTEAIYPDVLSVDSRTASPEMLEPILLSLEFMLLVSQYEAASLNKKKALIQLHNGTT